MARLRRTSATARRAAARLLRAEHREWAEALWAEAYDVPRGLPRLAWRAGGLRLIARQATMARRLACALLFGGAVAGASGAADPCSPLPLMGWRRGPGQRRCGRRAGTHRASAGTVHPGPIPASH
jgi:hypothetical protein